MSSTASRSPSHQAVRPSHHANDAGTAFQNPWPSAQATTWGELALQPFPIGWAASLSALRANPKARQLKVTTPDWGDEAKAAALAAGGRGETESDRCIVGTWLGHAGALVQMPLEGTEGGMATARGAAQGRKKKEEEEEEEEEERLCLLFDPIFSARAGPTQWMGPGRFMPSPCQVSDLPGCDIVFISHNHYDHLDLASVEAILGRFPRARYCVPLGNRRWFVEAGVSEELVCELDWWGDCEFRPEDFGYKLSWEPAAMETRVKITCVPAQHNSGRVGMDAGSTLWCGWAVEQFVGPKVTTADSQGRSKSTRKGAIYHAGDTGYRRSAKSDVVCPAFEEIGRKLGPFDLSFIPIWRGGSLGFISYLGLRLSHHDIPSTLHGSPTDAVSIHRDVKSRNTVGIHFGTFVGSENEIYEAIIEFGKACDEQGVRGLEDRVEGEHGRAGTLDIGASLAVEIA